MVKLRSVGLTPAYRKSRHEAGLWLWLLVAELGMRLHKGLRPQVIDRWLAKAVQEAFDRGFKLYQATLGVLALQQAYGLSGPLLRNTWAVVKGWRTVQVSKPRIPLTKYRLECMVLVAMSRGLSEDGLGRYRWWSAGLAWWLGFTCLLRPGEILNLHVGDIQFPEGPGEEREGLGAVVVIRRPKTRRIWREQFVLCQDSRLVKWLQWWLRGRSPHKSVFGFARHALVQRFSEALAYLGLADVGYTLGSLRAGGATDFFRRTRNLGELQYMGRWSAPSTLQHYLMEAFSAHVAGQCSSFAQTRLENAHDNVDLLDCPPGLSAQALLSRDWS